MDYDCIGSVRYEICPAVISLQVKLWLCAAAIDTDIITDLVLIEQNILGFVELSVRSIRTKW